MRQQQVLSHRTALLAALFLAPSAALHAGEDARPIVGAIRWDGWYGEGGVCQAVESSLGQPKYHFRLPWFARVIENDKVSINGDTQAIMEKEIGYAAQAGLNYWAMVDYWNQCPGMSTASRTRSAARSAAASGRWSSAPCGAELFLFLVTEEDPHRIRQSRNRHWRQQSLPQSATLRAVWSAAALLPPAADGALLHAVRSSSSSQRLKKLRTASGRAGTATGGSRACRSPQSFAQSASVVLPTGGQGPSVNASTSPIR